MSTVKTNLESVNLSELSYTDYKSDLTANQYLARLQGVHDSDELTGGNYSGDGLSGITLDKAKTFAGVTEERNEETNEIIKDDNGNVQYKFETDAETGEKTSGYSILSTSQEMGIESGDFQGMFVKNNVTGEITYAIRGTQLTSLGDLWADYNLAMDGNAGAQQEAVQSYYEAFVSSNSEISTGTTINVTGHSLGGFLVLILVHFARKILVYSQNRENLNGHF